jgi:SPP1 family predicted phage head-tail adaptor
MPAPEAGRLRSRLALQSPVVTRGADYGQPVTAWQTDVFLWGEVAPLTGREYFNRGETRAEISLRVTLRWRSGVTPKHRFLYGTRVLEIVDVIDTGGRHEELQCMCREVIDG